jgi:hypothetical protein
MNILIIQENGHHEANRSFRECFCLKRGFEHHGATVEIWGKGHYGFTRNPGQRMYDQYFSHFDLVFAIENWDWMPDMSRIHTKKFIWAIDAHCKGPRVYEQYGFDKVLHATKQFADEGCWLPNCYDDTKIKPLKGGRCNQYGVGFCGNTVNRESWIKYLQHHFNMRHDEMVLGNDMVRAINSYKLHWNANISVDVNYRNFETMGCQTCLLTSWHSDYQELGFVNEENCLMYKSDTECGDYIKLALSVDDLRDRVAKSGYELVKNNHTYKHRAKQILEIL